MLAKSTGPFGNLLTILNPRKHSFASSPNPIDVLKGHQFSHILPKRLVPRIPVAEVEVLGGMVAAPGARSNLLFTEFEVRSSKELTKQVESTRFFSWLQWRTQQQKMEILFDNILFGVVLWLWFQELEKQIERPQKRPRRLPCIHTSFYKDLGNFEQFTSPERFLLMGGIGIFYLAIGRNVTSLHHAAPPHRIHLSRLPQQCHIRRSFQKPKKTSSSKRMVAALGHVRFYHNLRWRPTIQARAVLVWQLFVHPRWASSVFPASTILQLVFGKTSHSSHWTFKAPMPGKLSS